MKYLVYVTTISPVTETWEVDADNSLHAIELRKAGEGHCEYSYTGEPLSTFDTEYVAVENEPLPQHGRLL